MSILHIIVLAVVQGLAELLPVSSSAHVIVASRLLKLDPSAPEMTFLIVMLHTGTMFAVILYFWKRWLKLLTESKGFIKLIIWATAVTGVVGFGLKLIIEKMIFERLLGHEHAEVEQLFKNLPLVAFSLFSVGVLIIWASRQAAKREAGNAVRAENLNQSSAIRIGIVQGLCLPFRGFSRSGATISTGLVLGVPRMIAEDFSFALAVVLTPPVILLQLRRLLKAAMQDPAYSHAAHLPQLLAPGILGMAFSFMAGLIALRWLSKWLEKGRWHFFGYYCVGFSGLVATLAYLGF